MNPPTDRECDLWTRVGTEYRAYPGLKLTIAQAARLWHADRATMQEVLDAMVAAAVLCQRDEGYAAVYVLKASDGMRA